MALIANFEQEIKKLPYIFKDFHKFDKKIDPKKLQFGSKLDKDGKSREEFYRVKKIISPELIQLNNNLIVRLLGVKEYAEVNGEATQFLKDKTRNQQ